MPDKKKILTHAACWLLFIIYEQSAIFITMGNWSLFYRSLFYYACNIALFYLHQRILDQTVPRKGAFIWLAVFLTAAELGAVLVLKYTGNRFFNERDIYGGMSYWHLVLLDLHRSLFFVGLATLIWSIRRIGSFRQRAAEAERDRAQLEVQLAGVQAAYYQHQLNPHLLFNTLNFIYNGVAGHSYTAARSVLLLADIQRFCLRESGPADKILLDEELKQIDNLIELNRLRFGDRFSMRWTVAGETGGVRIIPLILLTITENIYKHGLVTDAAKPAVLELRLDTVGNLLFHVQNYKRREAQPAVEGSGLGIRNTRIRLNNAYPGGFSLDIHESENTYDLNLHIRL